MQQQAFEYALQAALALTACHAVCCSIIIFFDLSGRWDAYKLNAKRSVSVHNYIKGAKSFVADVILLFLPIMTYVFSLRLKEINESQDSISISLLKLAAGYVLGKVWACGMHYVLHFPSLYCIHRRHHANPREIVASGAWEDSFAEYLLMEIPSFALTILLYPTHFSVHLLHFCWHGWDGACSHSGFKPPGIWGLLFDSEYHYHHHAHLTVNYAEVEILDYMLGTHHLQRRRRSKEFQTSSSIRSNNNAVHAAAG